MSSNQLNSYCCWLSWYQWWLWTLDLLANITGGILLNNSLQLVLMAVMAMMVANTRASPFVLIDPATGRAVQQVVKNFKYTIWPKYAKLGNILPRTMQQENNFALCISNDYIEDTNMQKKMRGKDFFIFPWYIGRERHSTVDQKLILFQQKIWLFRRVPIGTGATRLCSKNRRRTTRRWVLNVCSVGLLARVFMILLESLIVCWSCEGVAEWKLRKCVECKRKWVNKEINH